MLTSYLNTKVRAQGRPGLRLFRPEIFLRLRVRRSCPPSRLSRLLAPTQEASFAQAGGARPRLHIPLRSGTERLFGLCRSAPRFEEVARRRMLFGTRRARR